jgi:hypothetical protein
MSFKRPVPLLATAANAVNTAVNTAATAAANTAVSVATAAAVAALLATAPAAHAQEHGIPPLAPGDYLRERASIAPAHPRAGEFNLGPVWMFDLGANAKGHSGWGGVLNCLIYSPRENAHPDWQLKMGGELLVFHTNEAHDETGLRHKESLDAGTLTFLFGGVWNPTERLEIGLLAGFGLAGTYIETRQDYTDGSHHTDYNGNVNWAMHVHPSLTVHFTENASFTAGYRFGFITPILRTENKWVRDWLDNYRTVDVLHHSLEAAFTLRF